MGNKTKQNTKWALVMMKRCSGLCISSYFVLSFSKTTTYIKKKNQIHRSVNAWTKPITFTILRTRQVKVGNARAKSSWQSSWSPEPRSSLPWDIIMASLQDRSLASSESKACSKGQPLTHIRTHTPLQWQYHHPSPTHTYTHAHATCTRHPD